MIPILLVSSKKDAVKNLLKERHNNAEKSVLITLKPLESEYSINQIREIQREVQIDQPILRTYILEEFDSASLEAQNAFLKLLEAPPDNVEFILTVSNIYSVLPTIVSRTKIIRLDKKNALDLAPAIAKALDVFIAKAAFNTLNFTLFTCQSKEESLNMIEQFALFFHRRLPTDLSAPPILREILKVNWLIKNNNLNHQLAVDHLLIFIQKKYSMKV